MMDALRKYLAAHHDPSLYDELAQYTDGSMNIIQLNEQKMKELLGRVKSLKAKTFLPAAETLAKKGLKL